MGPGSKGEGLPEGGWRGLGTLNWNQELQMGCKMFFLNRMWFPKGAFVTPHCYKQLANLCLAPAVCQASQCWVGGAPRTLQLMTPCILTTAGMRCHSSSHYFL